MFRKKLNVITIDYEIVTGFDTIEKRQTTFVRSQMRGVSERVIERKAAFDAANNHEIFNRVVDYKSRPVQYECSEELFLTIARKVDKNHGNDEQ